MDKIKFPVEDAYYILNSDNKLELHLPGKTSYQNLNESIKEDIKKSFIWGRMRGAWVSRSKGGYIPYNMQKYDIAYKGAKDVNISTPEERANKLNEKSEFKAEKYNQYAANASKRAEALQADFNKYRKDWSWLTQPILDTTGGRRFANHKQKVMARYERGMQEYNKSNYFKERAQFYSNANYQKQFKDRYYLEQQIKKLNKRIKVGAQYLEKYAEKDLSNLPANEQIYIQGRLNDYIISINDYAFFTAKLSELNADSNEMPIDVMKKKIKKDFAEFLKKYYNIQLTSIRIDFESKSGITYIYRTKEDLPEIIHSGWAAGNVAQMELKRLYKLMDKIKNEKEPQSINNDKKITMKESKIKPLTKKETEKPNFTFKNSEKIRYNSKAFKYIVKNAYDVRYSHIEPDGNGQYDRFNEPIDAKVIEKKTKSNDNFRSISYDDGMFTLIIHSGLWYEFKVKGIEVKENKTPNATNAKIIPLNTIKEITMKESKFKEKNIEEKLTENKKIQMIPDKDYIKNPYARNERIKLNTKAFNYVINNAYEIREYLGWDSSEKDFKSGKLVNYNIIPDLIRKKGAIIEHITNGYFVLNLDLDKNHYYNFKVLFNGKDNKTLKKSNSLKKLKSKPKRLKIAKSIESIIDSKNGLSMIGQRHKQKFSEAKKLPLKQLRVEPKIFQGRTVPYAGATVDKIVREGYDISQEPIVVYQASNNDYIVISGHSRFTAAQKLNMQTIPAKIYNGDFEEAVDFALLESNRSSNQEGIESDIKAYIRAKQRSYNKEFLLSIFKTESYIALLRNLSYLNPQGIFIEIIARGEDNEAKSFPYLLRNATWVGQLRRQYPELKNEHEKEMFDFFYKNKKGQNIKKQSFFDIIKKKVENPYFQPQKLLRLNVENEFEQISKNDPGYLNYRRKQAELIKYDEDLMKKLELYAYAIIKNEKTILPKLEAEIVKLNRILESRMLEVVKLRDDLRIEDKRLEATQLFSF